MLNFDEQNVMKSQRSVPYEKYFGDMELTDKQKNERIDFSNRLEEIILLIFAMIEVMKQYGGYEPTVIVTTFVDKYKELCEEFNILDDYMMLYVTQMVEEIVNASIENENEYYLSADRGMFISENEANAVLNYKDFQKAIADGKTKKQWLDIRDSRERKSHKAVGRKVIDIKKPFIVGDSEMMFPKDKSLGASDREIINCRCSIKYM